MFGPIGGYELLLILVLALLLFGPRKMPQIGRTIARALSELRSAATDFKADLEREVRLDELKQVGDEIGGAKRELDDAVRSVARGAVGATTPSPKPDGPAPADAGGPDDDEPTRGV